MELKKARSHVTLVAVLHISFGALAILGAVIAFMAMNFATVYIPEDEQIARDILGSVGIIITAVIAVFGTIDLLAGVSLFSYQQWSRILVIVISAINCLNIPIGTAKGVYSIWALMQPEIQELFD